MFIVNKIVLAAIGLAIAFVISTTEEKNPKPLKAHIAEKATKEMPKHPHNRW